MRIFMECLRGGRGGFYGRGGLRARARRAQWKLPPSATGRPPPPGSCPPSSEASYGDMNCEAWGLGEGVYNTGDCNLQGGSHARLKLISHSPASDRPPPTPSR